MDAQNGTSGEIFERLWLLRACYPVRSDYDNRRTMSVDEAIAYGEALMRNGHIRHRLGGGFSQPNRAI